MDAVEGRRQRVVAVHLGVAFELELDPRPGSAKRCVGVTGAAGGGGRPGSVRELWFSPPGRMPLGVSLGAATFGGRMFVTLRFVHQQFSAAAARAFLGTYEQVLRGA